MPIRMTKAEAIALGISIPNKTRLLPCRPVLSQKQTPQELFGEMALLRYGKDLVPEYSPVPGRKYRIDFAFPADKLAIEIDGWQYHGKTLGAFRNDRTRQNELAVAGWLILRFPAGDVSKDIGSMFRTIDRCLANIRSRNSL